MIPSSAQVQGLAGGVGKHQQLQRPSRLLQSGELSLLACTAAGMRSWSRAQCIDAASLSTHAGLCRPAAEAAAAARRPCQQPRRPGVSVNAGPGSSVAAAAPEAAVVDGSMQTAAAPPAASSSPLSSRVGLTSRDGPRTGSSRSSAPAQLPLIGAARNMHRTRRAARRLAQQVARLERRLAQLQSAAPPTEQDDSQPSTSGRYEGSHTTNGSRSGGGGGRKRGAAGSATNAGSSTLLEFSEAADAGQVALLELLQGSLLHAQQRQEELQQRNPRTLEEGEPFAPGCIIMLGPLASTLQHAQTLTLTSSINRRKTVIERLEQFSAALDLPMDLVLSLVSRHEPLLAVPPPQLRRRLAIISQQALRLPVQDTAEALAAAPQLLAWPELRLEAAAQGMWAALAARGLQPSAVLRARPDLLTQAPATVAAKLDALPALLGLSARAARQLIGRRPDLLRRSPKQLQRRYLQLQSLLNIPPSFVAELVMAEPRAICLSAASVRAKFDALVDRWVGGGRAGGGSQRCRFFSAGRSSLAAA
jgi:hypothetical protein